MSAALILFGMSVESGFVVSQGPLPPVGGGNLARLPNDQIEGTIWEYKATPKAKYLKGEKTDELKGKFRLEEDAIFDLGARLTLPEDGPKELFEKLKSGGEIELKLPGGPQQKRIGEYRKLDNGGKYRLDFDDKESLHGIMIIWKKEKTSDVWIGSYRAMDGKEVKAEYMVELKPIED